MSNSDFIAALPTASPAVKTLLRNSLIQRVIYPFSETEDVQTWDALDGDTGALPEAISKYGNVYALDPDDTTTVHDDATCQVTQDGYRYKVQGVALRPTSVLDKDLTTPPDISDSPPVALGDAYLVPAGATDDWAAFPDYIALWTSRGWAFEAPRIGRLIYVEDEDSYYHYNVDGDWAAGVGQSALSDNSVFARHLLGGRTHWVVINQTTNAPPSLTGGGNAYIIGASPTGAWAGNAGKIAQDQGSSWGIYTPAEGWTADDQDQNGPYRYNGSAWIAQAGAIVGAEHQYTAGNGSTTNTGQTGAGAGAAYSSGSPPTTSHRRRTDDVIISHAAKKTNARLRFEYSCKTNGTTLNNASLFPSAATSFIVALFRDSDATAIKHRFIGTTTYPDQIFVVLEVTASDSISHDYKIAILPTTAGTGQVNDPNAMEARDFSMLEFA